MSEEKEREDKQRVYNLIMAMSDLQARNREVKADLEKRLREAQTTIASLTIQVTILEDRLAQYEPPEEEVDADTTTD